MTASLILVFSSVSIAERAKRVLSKHVNAEFKLGELRLRIIGPTFETLCKALFSKVLGILEAFISSAKLEKSEVSEVVLVGGSSRIPKIQDLVSEFFDGKKISRTGLGGRVAHGAAVLATKLSQDPKIRLQDLDENITLFSFGVRLRGGLMKPIIPQGSAFPITASKLFGTVVDDQESFPIEIIEGVSPMCGDNNRLGVLKLTGLTPAPRGVVKVLVTFAIDAEENLTVTASENINSNNTSMRRLTKDRLTTDSDACRMLQLAYKFQASNEANAHRAIAQNRLARSLENLQANLSPRGAEDQVVSTVKEIYTWLTHRLETDPNMSAEDVWSEERTLRDRFGPSYLEYHKR